MTESGASSFSRAFLGSAISTAASPLRSGFIDLTCRSPVTTRRPRHDGDALSGNGLSVETEKPQHGSYSSVYLPTPSSVSTERPSRNSNTYGSRRHSFLSSNGLESGSSVTLVSPTDPTFLPSTPSLLFPSTNGSYVDPEDGKLGTFSAINIILGKTVGVGIYSIPSSILLSVGSVGASLLLWVLGSLISFCGLAVYLDLGTAIPRSGGERVYLERIFRRPRMLASCMFMAYVVLLGFSTPNCIVLGEYVMYALSIEVNRWNVRLIAVAVITILCIIHARYQRLGLQIINVLGVGKMLILVIVILTGLAGLTMGVGRGHLTLVDRRIGGHEVNEVHMPTYMLTTAQRNFRNIWDGSSTQPYDYATALLKILYCFRGYSTANQVLSEVRNPVRTLRIAAPIALILVSLSYILANIAYFMAVEIEDFRSSGVVVAGHFFTNVFGDVVGERILPCFIIISAFGNIAATSFAQARVNQELGRDGLLPFATFFKGSGTPIRGLLLHWFVSVVVIVVPPPGEIYNFLVDIGGYPVSVISVSISLGLLYLQGTPSEKWESPFRAKKFYIVVFLLSNCFLLIFPWLKPKTEKGRFPYYAYPATALAILGSGIVYWVWWAKVKPGFSSATAFVKGHKATQSEIEDALMLDKLNRREIYRVKGSDQEIYVDQAEALLDDNTEEVMGRRASVAA
jgi:amino acid transporter